MTSCDQFLEYNTAHIIHIKKSIVYIQGLWNKLLCSSTLAFEKHLDSIHPWFWKRVHTKKHAYNQLTRVIENRPKQLSQYQAKHGIGVLLVVTYHSRFHDLGRIIRKNHIY